MNTRVLVKMRRQPVHCGEIGDWVMWLCKKDGRTTIWPHRLTEPRGRNKRDAGEMTPVRINGPRGVVDHKKHEGIWYWIVEVTP